MDLVAMDMPLSRAPIVGLARPTMLCRAHTAGARLTHTPRVQLAMDQRHWGQSV
jgi:hypothetical protein